ncbi:hypothetical protein M427DRAFT_46808 [Gonapodya prolifera JEL478]|uniref:Uncharacterized protein n=1 Tax=Gonapodya prolifera (strain JEL478) TaxID=1344416 RepID=A0A139A4P4_GONPJ|nr:hypothetical protein M427DRAFT_46808 [Gonapodya prolifera JEL478]|eukprot:KXS11782.1 hypothetical protein M427DRAFT_46808 [Gonapodya prolifera JEL478]
MPRVYPNLLEQGTLTVWRGKKKWADSVVFDCRSVDASVLEHLRSIQTFGFMVFATDLFAAPSTDNFITLTKSIFEIMPGITTSKITVDVVTPRRRYNEVPGCDAIVLQFLEDLLRVGKRQSRSLRARMELLSPGHGMKKLHELCGSVHEVERTFGCNFQTMTRNAGVSLYSEESYVFDDT